MMATHDAFPEVVLAEPLQPGVIIRNGHSGARVLVEADSYGLRVTPLEHTRHSTSTVFVLAPGR